MTVLSCWEGNLSVNLKEFSNTFLMKKWNQATLRQEMQGATKLKTERMQIGTSSYYNYKLTSKNRNVLNTEKNFPLKCFSDYQSNDFMSDFSFSLIHRFTVSVAILILFVFRRLLLRNGKLVLCFKSIIISNWIKHYSA